MGFGSFELLCQRANIPLCALVGPYEGSTPFGQGLIVQCYARSVVLANTMVFNIGAIFIHLGALLVTAMAIYTIYGKYTAVGRREMLDLFYLFMGLEAWTLVVDAGVAPSSSETYPYFVAIQCGLASSFCWLLLLTSLLGYQFWEDGSAKSVWSLRASSFAWGLTVFLVALFTFNGGKQGWPNTLNPKETTALMVVLYVINAIFILFYACFTFYFCAVLIRDWWASGSYALALFFLISGQLLMFAFGRLICEHTRHYIDGIFFATFCNMVSFLMIYRAYDTVTAEDLEFTVSLKDSAWETRSVSEETDSQYALSNYSLRLPN